MAERLTTARIQALTCPPDKSRLYVNDAAMPGLQIYVTRGGAKTFCVYKKVFGRPARIRLGAWPHELGLDDARKAAQKINGEIAAGIDPREARRAARAELTFGDLMTAHIEAAKQHNKTWADDEAAYRRHLKSWASRRLSAITRSDVQALHGKLGAVSPYSANRVLALVSHAFRVTAPDHGYAGPNPAAGVQRFRERSRERFLQADELPKFFAALAEAPQPARDFFAVALFTGARRANVQAMRWSDVNLERREWRIPETKNGQAVVIALAGPVVDVLTRRAGAKGVYVFPGSGKSGHYHEPSRAWRSICRRAGLTDLRIHDLRRTLGSWQAAMGASTAIIGKSLGHQSTASTAVYARLALAPVRDSVERAAAGIIAAGIIPHGTSPDPEASR